MSDKSGATTAEAMTEFVLQSGGRRLIGQRRFVRKCCDWVIEAQPEPTETAVLDVIKKKSREEYGSILGAILVTVAAQLIVKAILEWWKRRQNTILA